MKSKDLLQIYRATEWRGSTDVQAFIDAAGLVRPRELLAMLQILLDRRAAAEGRAHMLRQVVFQRLVEQSQDKSLFRPFVQALPHASPRLRELLAELIPKVDNLLQHEALVELFWSGDPAIRRIAKTLAHKIRGRTAFALLMEALQSSVFPGRIEAMDAVVSMGGPSAIPGLHAVMEKGAPLEKRRALQYLVRDDIGPKSPDLALKAIAVGLRDDTEQIVIDAIEAYGKIGEEDEFFDILGPALDSGSLRLVRAVVSSMGRYDSPRALALLRRQFRLGPRSVRIAILETLEVMATETVLPLVADALDHKHITVRMKAAEVLQNLAASGKVDVVRTVLWLLRSKDRDVKRIAADVARRVGDTDGRLWPQLLGFLRDEDWWVRERITDALIEMAGPQLTRHVVGFLSDESDVVRRYGVDMLVRLNDPASLGALVRTAAGDDDWWVRERSVEAIGQLGDERAVPYLLDLLNKQPALTIVILNALTSIGSTKAGQHVAELLHSDDPDVVHEALVCLDRLNDPRQGMMVAVVTNHDDPRIRKLATEIMHRWRVAENLAGAQATLAKRLSTLERLLFAAVQAGADDLILSAGKRPFIKRMGAVQPLAKTVFTDEQIRALILPNLTEAQHAQLTQLQDIDMSYDVKLQGLRFRVNVFEQQGGLAAVFRYINDDIPELAKLGLPEVVTRFGDYSHGLVLIGGPTGSGKSTTLAALIDYINRSHAKHIITLEDPIEVIHTPRKSLINQREIGQHTPTFGSALRATLREDPDVILVGEMRDLETISFAITAAETGHLVFGTVHTSSADASIDRIINMFPFGQQPQVRSILANSLRAVCCQHLLPAKGGEGRVVAAEVLINTEAVANLIRKGKTYQIPTVVAMGRDQGMQSMDNELIRLVKRGLVEVDDAYMKAVNKKEFEAIVEGRDPTEARAEAEAELEGL